MTELDIDILSQAKAKGFKVYYEDFGFNLEQFWFTYPNGARSPICTTFESLMDSLKTMASLSDWVCSDCGASFSTDPEGAKQADEHRRATRHYLLPQQVSA